jgi:hypothetical protein
MRVQVIQHQGHFFVGRTFCLLISLFIPNQNQVRHRLQIELFFKWVKQHLKIKPFHGLSENVMKTQIRVAISIYVLVAIIMEEVETGSKSLYDFTGFRRHAF